MTETLLLGIDVGTGSARAGLFTVDGRQVGRGAHPIKLWQTTPEHAEQSSDDIWRAVGIAVRAALGEANVDANVVRGIGFDATCSLVAIDGSGGPVSVSPECDDERNVVVWMDHRALADAEEINRLGHPVLAFVGGSISPEMQTPKLRWLKRELPDCWRRTELWLDLPDFLTWRATGSEARSLCSTVCKWTYLGHERRWDESYFELIGLQDLADTGFRSIGTDVRVPGELVGELSNEAAVDLGLVPGIPVATSLIDAHAGALGTLGAPGVDVPITQRLAIIAGTSACHLAVTPERVSVPGVWGPYFEALTPNSWLLEAGISASGAFLDHALRSHPASAGIEDVFAFVEKVLATSIDAGATEETLSRDLHLQSNVLGNRSPLADPKLRGGIAGWGLRDDPEDLARWYVAALQALAYATRHIVEAMREAGCGVDLLMASGGSAANPRWCQTHADAVGVPLAVPEEPDGVLLGSAMLGGRAAGLFDSLDQAMGAMAKMGTIVQPDEAKKDFHDRKYAVYRRMIDDQLAYDSIMQGQRRHA